MNSIVQSWNPAALLHSPPFAPLRAVIEALDVSHWPECADLNRMLAAHAGTVTTAGGEPLRFVGAYTRAVSFEERYEPSIFLRGEVQVRARNWHDLFNALVWATFPHAKAALNERHYRELVRQHDAGASNRGRTQDVLTLFDEGGLIVATAGTELAALLREFKWKELFWTHRAELDRLMRFYLFGHAIYEKALAPFTGITARAAVFDVPEDFLSLPLHLQLDQLDRHLAARLKDSQLFLHTRELAPVPILGIPGWCAENEKSFYYDNTEYFRSGYRRQSIARR